MKKIKIILAVVVLLVISIGTFFWIQNMKDPGLIKPPATPYTPKIEQGIEKLNAMPANKSCKEFYNELSYNINEFYKPAPPTYPYGRFGKTQLENDQWRDIFEKRLYAVYMDKFIQLTKNVLNASAWNQVDLKFIQSEMNVLKKSKYYVGSPFVKEFLSIQTALNKYYDIVTFISVCRAYNYTETDLDKGFPIADVQSKIARSANLLKSGLGNPFVNNCTRLHTELKEVPQLLFSSHIKYLDTKISVWSGKYSSDYVSYKLYNEDLFIPIKAEIENLDNSIYNVSNFDSEYVRLSERWSKDKAKAFSYKY